jgi:hypothetical protein
MGRFASSLVVSQLAYCLWPKLLLESLLYGQHCFRKVEDDNYERILPISEELGAWHDHLTRASAVRF